MTAPAGVAGPSPTVDSEVTWLLHRAAQRMRGATGQVAEEHGISMRELIVLSALTKTPGLTQGELGKALGLDKTTLMSQLDLLEGRNLIVRHNAPHDRRLRIPVITEAGETLRATVAQACESVEAALLNGFAAADVQALRRMLFAIIGTAEDRGSCL